MKPKTRNELKQQVDRLVEEGCGNRYIILTSDDKANEYLGAWLGYWSTLSLTRISQAFLYANV